jgi:hypothetical protein
MMTKFASRFLLIAALAASIGLAASPMLSSVEPDSGKPGDEAAIKGQNLDKVNVIKLFLTDGKNDHLVEIKEQTADTIRFTIPANIKPGRYNLMFQTATALLEQPFAYTVIE